MLYELKDSKKRHMVLRVLNFLEGDPWAYERLTMFLDDRRFLIGIDDMVARTGWSKSYIYKLCEANKLPHIPGTPLKFAWSDVEKAVRKMQRGGEFRRRSSMRKKRTKSA